MHGHIILALIRSLYWSVASMFLSYGCKNLNVTPDAPTLIFFCNDMLLYGKSTSNSFLF
jgi:hypothetical protein